MLVTNDPWLCAGHLFDIAVVTPVFRDGRLVGLIGTVGHVTDIGGTKDSLRAREIYEEGLQIPPMKLYEAGGPTRRCSAAAARTCAIREQVLGDVHSLVAANALGAERLLAFMDEYGLHDLAALAAVVQGRSEKAMRDGDRARAGRRLRERARGTTRAATPLRYPVKLTVSRRHDRRSTSTARRRSCRRAASTAR